MLPPPRRSTLFPYTTLFRSSGHDRRSLIRSGLAWLIANQNADGGWGDTVVSFSNLSTTMLCWSALSLCVDAHESTRTAIERAEDRKSTRLNSSHITISYAVF